MRPLIGITCDYDATAPGKFWLREEYAAAVLAAGGTPLLLAPLEGFKIADITSNIRGILISGGDFDIEPERYGEAPLPELGKMNPRRSRFEADLCRRAFEMDLPTLGICGGMQAINVAFGGSLYQDIPTQLPHISINHSQGRQAGVHTVEIKADTLLDRLVRKKEIATNSSHHQAVKKVAPGFEASALAPGGIIEAIESRNHRFMIGLQWHPEVLFSREPVWLKVFEGLVRAGSGVKLGTQEA